jgi:regulator of PEP synthase PpsR (kinase-PPPase family)
MSTEAKTPRTTPLPPIYVVSGATGASAEQVVFTVLAQFPESKVPVITVPYVQRLIQIEDIVTRATSKGGIIVHTLVESHLRQGLAHLAQERGVVAIDLMGDLLSHLASVLGQEPLGKPGLYRRLNLAYFERVEAINFSMTHDDGKRPDGWPEADIVLVGVSRAGKTPLSMYLAVLGWKVANVPLIPDIPPPPELLQLDRRRVIGLNIEPGQLILYRQQRVRHLGAPGLGAYADPARVYEEVEDARRICQRNRFTMIDVTDKPIETSANQVIELITRRFGTKERGERYASLP